MDIGDKYYKGKPWPTWEGNIMAEFAKGRVEEKNIETIIKRAHWRRTPFAMFVEP
jgi:hypothetical protein